MGLVSKLWEKVPKIPQRVSLKRPAFIAGGVAIFAAGFNVCLFGMIATGRIPCSASAGPLMHSIGALPHVWCPAHGGTSLVKKTLQAHQPGQLVIDVGAFDGTEAIEYASAGHRVLSFEPTPSKAGKIRQRLRDEGVENSVEFHQWAISDHQGEEDFIVNVGVHLENGMWAVNEDSDSQNPDNMGSEQDGFTAPWGRANSTTVKVKVEKIDNLVKPDEHVLFMKVDSQGHDFKVLKGAQKLLSEHRILVFSAEVSPGLMKGGAEEAVEMLEWIAARGYQCFGCQTSFETGFRYGLPIPYYVWTQHLATLKFEHRGANHGQWDDIVCFSKHASSVFKPMAFAAPPPPDESFGSAPK